MLSKFLGRGNHYANSSISIRINDDAQSAEYRSVMDTLEVLKLQGKVLHISLVSTKEEMYSRVIGDFISVTLTNMQEIKDENASELNSQERKVLSKELSTFVNDLMYVCYDELNLGELRVLLRSKKFDKILVTAPRYDRTLKFKLGQLGKDFKTKVQLNLYPKRKL